MPLEMPPGLWMPPKPGIIRAAPDIRAPYLGAFTMLARTSLLRKTGAAAAPAAYVVTQIGTAVATTNVTSLNLTIPAGGVPAGAAMFLCMMQGQSQFITVSDTAGNSWLQDTSGYTPDFLLLATSYYSFSVAALVSGNTITMFVTGGASGTLAATAFYVTGGPAPLSTANSGSVTATSGTSTTPSAVSATAAATFWLGYVGSVSPTADTFTQDTVNGWAAPPTRISSNTGSPICCIAGGTLAAIATSKTYAPTLGTSRQWACAVASYS